MLARQIAAIRELEESGASVHLVSRRRRRTKNSDERIRRSSSRLKDWPPIRRGVVHAAGCLQDGLLLSSDWRCE